MEDVGAATPTWRGPIHWSGPGLGRVRELRTGQRRGGGCGGTGGQTTGGALYPGTLGMSLG